MIAVKCVKIYTTFQVVKRTTLGPTEWEAGWAPELVWAFLEKRKSLAPVYNYLCRHTVRLCSF